MTSRLAGLIAPALVLAALGAPARADILAQWTFETSVPASAGPFAAENGANAATSMASGFHTSTATVYSNPVGNGSGESYSSNNWSVGDYYQFTTSTAGYQGLSVSFDQTRSGTGPAEFDFQYSTDGVSFTTFGSYTLPNVSWSSTTPDATGTTSFSFNLATITALDNLSTVYFRMTATAAPGASGGTSRIDNVTITAVPEPASLALVGMGVVGMIGLRSRRKMQRA